MPVPFAFGIDIGKYSNSHKPHHTSQKEAARQHLHSLVPQNLLRSTMLANIAVAALAFSAPRSQITRRDMMVSLMPAPRPRHPAAFRPAALGGGQKKARGGAPSLDFKLDRPQGLQADVQPERRERRGRLA